MTEKTISFVAENKLCHSCGACSASCPHEAIDFLESVGGLQLPQVSLERCTGCGLCVTACPGYALGETLLAELPVDPFKGEVRASYVGKSLDKNIYENSQSGGIVTSLLLGLLEEGKIDAALTVFMDSGSPPRARAKLAQTKEDLLNSQKSKYSPVPLLSLLSRLGENRRIVIVGLACHMHGLKKLLKIFPELEKMVVLTIGLVCDRVSSTAAIDFLSLQAWDDLSITKGFVFRDKQQPNYPGNVVIMNNKHELKVVPAAIRMAIKDFFTPPRCRICFDKLNVFSDLVAGDPHGINDIDRVNGEGLVIARTETGMNFLNTAVEKGRLQIRDCEIEQALAGQRIDRKKRYWNAINSCWREFGVMAPDYVGKIADNQFDPGAKIKRTALRDLKLGFALDNYRTRSELLQAAELWNAKKMENKDKSGTSFFKNIFSVFKSR